MNDSRKKMLERVRAVLAKTRDNGCTESEAMAALAKAQQLIAAYDISVAELGHTQDSEAVSIHEDAAEDPHLIKRHLLFAVSLFTRCRSWYCSGLHSHVAFCGLESDVAFATWLLDTLAAFVLRELKAHQAQRRAQGMRNPRIVTSSFVMGCVHRIGVRLKDLAPLEPTTTTGNALAISHDALIDEAMKKAGIKLCSTSSRGRRVDGASYGAGQVAGNAARFDRPVSTSGGLLRLTR
ncbi:hypothetical protein ABIF69_000181 [Bradyrhizobium japonicum]